MPKKLSPEEVRDRKEVAKFLKKATKSAQEFQNQGKLFRIGGKDSCIVAKSGYLTSGAKKAVGIKKVKFTGVVGSKGNLGFVAVEGSIKRYLRATAAHNRKAQTQVIDLTLERCLV